MIHRSLFTVLLLCALSGAYAQKPAQLIRLGDEAMAAGRHDEAFGWYDQAYQLDSTNFDATVKLAEEARAVKYYSYAAQLYAKIYAKDKGKLFPEGLFWLAMMQKMEGQYDEARTNFRKYLKKNKKKGNWFHDRAEQEAEACAWAINYEQTSDSLVVRAIDGGVNTEQSEIAPVLHDSLLHFSRWSGAYWQLLQSPWKDSTAAAGNNSFFGAHGMADWYPHADGSWTATRALDDGTTRIVWSADGTLARAEDVSEWISGGTSTMATLARIQGLDYVFFASDRDGGEGGMDIWISRRQGDGWETPFNAGDIVNTPGDELTPFYTHGHLYFSSDWHAGFGGQDVFRLKGTPGIWGKPENLGKPVNSARNDLFFVLYPETYTCLLSSNREGGVEGETYSGCCNDLYLGRFSPKEMVADETIDNLAELNRVLPVRLYFHNDEPNPDSWDTTTTITYSDAYRSYKKLQPTYTKESTRGLSGDEEEAAELDVEDFFRLQVDKGMEDLALFERLLLDELEQGKHIQLSIRGFASPRAQSDYNENLTKRRIASLVNELGVANGGVFIPYILGKSRDGGRLTFVALPFGENKADTLVSDDLADTKRSIYSRGARLERKIEIESVEVVPPVPGSVQPETTHHNFGTIPRLGGVVRHTFWLTNPGETTMVIDSVAASCGCTEPVLERMSIEPGARVRLDVGFDPFGKKGHDQREIMVYPHGEDPVLLTIEAIVE